MKNNFERCLAFVLDDEGGWSDNPKDPGGATMYGVTLTTFRSCYGGTKTKQDLKRITNDQLREIYKKYWDGCQCDNLPTGLDYVAFDSAINSGQRRANQWLTGSFSLAASFYNVSTEHVIVDYLSTRLNFLRDLKAWETFGKGWKARIERVRERAFEMVKENANKEPE